jgi:hypothetical protein
MKKLSLFFAVMLFTVVSGFSQATIKPSVGFSFNDFSETSTGDAKGKLGMQLGGSVAFGKKFYVEPGVFYATKSSEFTTSSSSSSSVTEDAVIKGIRVPLAVGVGVLGNEKSLASLRVFGGGSGFFVTGVGDALVKDNITSPTWGVFAGAGVDFWIMFAEASYEWSLSNVTTDVANIDFGKSRTLFFTVGFRF